jgi:glycosyltransferase involved in cell wall biosynthesis
MKIIYLSGATLPSSRANSVHVMRMCSAMTRAGHSVTLVARHGGVDAHESIFNYYGIDKSSRFNLRLQPLRDWPLLRGLSLSWPLLSYLRKRQCPDLFYSRYPTVAALASFLGIKLVFEVHAVPTRALDRIIEGVVLSSTNLCRLVTISQVLKDDYSSIRPDLRAKIVVAHDAADPHPVVDPIPDWPGRKSVPQVGYVGSVYPGKGVEIVVQLAQRFPNVDFHIVGGTVEDLARWQPLTSLANLTLHGHVPHYRLPAYYRQLHIALAPLQRKVSVDFGSSDIGRWTSPLKIFEYMAAGLPIIASDIPTLREVLVDGRTAVLVPPEDVGAWEAALRKLISQSGNAQRMGALAHEDFCRLHTWDARVRTVLEGLPIGA